MTNKMNLKSIIIISAFLLFLSCKKQVEVERPEFIGYWFSKESPNSDFYYSIEIRNDSYATYREHSWSGSGPNGTGVSIQGLARANNKRLKIGRIYSFKIKEYPHKIDTTPNIIVYTDITWSKQKKANWKMTLNGPMFHLGHGTYYKADY